MHAQAKAAIEQGASRICISAAWREVRSGKAFDTILEVVDELAQKGVEVCCTLGMMNQEQADQLAKAGLYAYNHNLDTSRRYYEKIITTRNYDDRLSTLKRAKRAGASLCCGGIIGLGESEEDRIALLETLVDIQPESIPFNFLSPIKGTPLENQKPLPIWEMLRMIATTRILMPRTLIRLSCGRIERSLEEQALCFFAGANSVFIGEKLLTTQNTSVDDDQYMFELFGLKTRPPFKEKREKKPIMQSLQDRFRL